MVITAVAGALRKEKRRASGEKAACWEGQEEKGSLRRRDRRGPRVDEKGIGRY